MTDQQLPMLDIQTYQGRQPDLRPASVNIVIDVLRAFTTSHVAFEHGVDQILLAETVDEAFDLADAHPDAVLAGERNAHRVEGFDIGNSPSVIRRIDFTDRRLILTTTNGVRATMCALDSDHTFVTGWSNAPATVRATRSATDDGQRVNLVASHPFSDEDPACADYLTAALRDDPTPPAHAVTDRIRTASSAMKFYSTQFRIRDLDLACRQFDGDYAMAVEMADGVPRLRRSMVAAIS